MGYYTPSEAKEIIKNQGKKITNPKNLEEQAIKLVGIDIYEKLIKGYTSKQWQKDPKELPKEIIKRLPVRFNYDNNYFNDKYQGIPIGGYTQIFDSLLKGLEIRLNTDFFNAELPKAKKIIYTGPIDKFYNYKYGKLEYKTTRFDHKKIETDNFQGTAMLNYTDIKVPYTRTIEHKHFEKIESKSHGLLGNIHKYIPEKTEPYYPVNDEINNKIYQKYKC